MSTAFGSELTRTLAGWHLYIASLLIVCWITMSILWVFSEFSCFYHLFLLLAVFPESHWILKNICRHIFWLMHPSALRCFEAHSYRLLDGPFRNTVKIIMSWRTGWASHPQPPVLETGTLLSELPGPVSYPSSSSFGFPEIIRSSSARKSGIGFEVNSLR